MFQRIYEAFPTPCKTLHDKKTRKKKKNPYHQFLCFVRTQNFLNTQKFHYLMEQMSFPLKIIPNKAYS